jgi:hypothetical protein
LAAAHRRDVRRSVLALVLTVVVASGCGSGVWHWTDPGVHVVAGAWVTDEVSCALDAPDLCGIAVRAASEWVRAHEPGVQVASGL